MGGLHIDDKIVGLSISQWLPCPLAIWNVLFGMAILLNLVKREDLLVRTISDVMPLETNIPTTISICILRERHYSWFKASCQKKLCLAKTWDKH